MDLFQWVVALLAGASVLALIARRITVPYPTLLALGGAALAFVPGVPSIRLDPQLALALFVAPVLLDAGFDTSLRDVKENWRPVFGLVFVAVGLTTFTVACAMRWFVPDLPWAAAIALGAIVAPPDAAAATAVLRQVRPPHQLLVILEAESLLNDATALVVYRVAVGLAVGTTAVVPALGGAALGIVLSVVAGPLVAIPIARIIARIDNVPISVVVQFVMTFGIWMIAEHLQLSPVLVVVTNALTLSRISPEKTPARKRVPSFVFWEISVFLLNVLAFILLGLQLRPILRELDPASRNSYLAIAGVVLATVVVTRIVWVMGYNAFVRARVRRDGFHPPRPTLEPTKRSGFVVAWSGMRGIVTLAGAFALPQGFPHRDLLVSCAFGVVLGTLVLMGFTLSTILRRAHLDDHDPVAREVREARMAAYQSAISAIEKDDSVAGHALQEELREILKQVEEGRVATEVDELRRVANEAARKTLLSLRRSGSIGDAAFQRVEEELDRLDLTTEESS